MKFRLDAHTRRVRCPKASASAYVLAPGEAAGGEQALLAWQDQILGPAQDRLLILDGKSLRHAGVETANAVNGTGRWLGSTLVRTGSNEIPAARAQLAKLDAVEKIFVADAAHTQVGTARQILHEQGGEQLLIVKTKQKDLVHTFETLFTERLFSPRPTARAQALTRERNCGRVDIPVVDA